MIASSIIMAYSKILKENSIVIHHNDLKICLQKEWANYRVALSHGPYKGVLDKVLGKIAHGKRHWAIVPNKTKDDRST